MNNFLTKFKYIFYLFLIIIFFNIYNSLYDDLIEVPLAETLLKYLQIDIINNNFLNSTTHFMIFFIIVFPSYFVFLIFNDDDRYFSKAIEGYHKGDFKKSLKILNSISYKNESDVQNLIGCIYDNKNSPYYDLKEAKKWYKLASDQGNENAQLNLGIMYDWGGDGIDQDFKKAVKFYKLAVKHAEDEILVLAQHALGYKYKNGEGITKDVPEAVQLFRLSADQGYEESQHILGCMYYEGEKEGVIQNFQEAVKWFKLAANQGNVTSQCFLGAIYYDGDEGLPQDFKKAFKWLKLGAKNGNSIAQYILGSMFDEGLETVQNDKQAIKWYKLSVEQGNDDAMVSLGLKYYFGEGVEESKVEAIKLFDMAANNGNEFAMTNLEMLSKDSINKEYKESLKKQKEKFVNKISSKTKQKNTVQDNIIKFPLR